MATTGDQVDSIRVTLPFIREIPGIKPYRIVGPLPAERENQRTNVTSVDIEGVEIHNARSRETTFSLDINGFEFTRFEPKIKLVGYDEATAECFLEGICAFLQGRFKTPYVFPYDLRVGSTVPTNAP
jgi:hypothetical protein